MAEHFAEAVPDYRNESYVRHPLCSIIMIVLFAVLADADEWGEIESFARKVAAHASGSSLWDSNRIWHTEN